MRYASSFTFAVLLFLLAYDPPPSAMSRATRPGSVPGHGAPVPPPADGAEDSAADQASAPRNVLADTEERSSLSSCSAAFYLDRGIAYTESGEYDRAVDSFTRAIELEPNEADPYGYRGCVYLKKNQPRLAAEDFGAVLRIDSSIAQAYRLRAGAYRLAGDTGRAKMDAEACLTCATASPEERRAAAEELAELGDLDRAIRVYHDLIRQTGPTAELLRDCGWAHLMKRDFAAAERDLTRALEIDPGDATLYLCRSEVRSRAGRLRAALADATEAISRAKFEKAASLYYWRAYLHACLNERRSQIADLNAVVSLAPRHLQARIDRGIALYWDREMEHARDDFEAAARVVPGNQQVKDYLGWIADWSSGNAPRVSQP